MLHHTTVAKGACLTYIMLVAGLHTSYAMIPTDKVNCEAANPAPQKYPALAQKKWAHYVHSLGRPEITVVPVPSWVPLGGFTIGSYIFLNMNTIDEPEDAQKRHIQHESIHVSEKHTIQQLGWAALYAAAYALVLRGTSCIAHIDKPLSLIGAYGVYALFHRQIVRPMELEAEVQSALRYHTIEQARTVLTREITEEAGGKNIPSSLRAQCARAFFTLIAPFHPTAQEYLDHLNAAAKARPGTT